MTLGSLIDFQEVFDHLLLPGLQVSVLLLHSLEMLLRVVNEGHDFDEVLVDSTLQALETYIRLTDRRTVGNLMPLAFFRLDNKYNVFFKLVNFAFKHCDVKLIILCISYWLVFPLVFELLKAICDIFCALEQLSDKLF